MAKATKPASVSPADNATSDYIVTDTAPPRVAGRRAEAGDHLLLREDEARGELLALHIRSADVTQVSTTE